jgi:hypothetical protein
MAELQISNMQPLQELWQGLAFFVFLGHINQPFVRATLATGQEQDDPRCVNESFHTVSNERAVFSRVIAATRASGLHGQGQSQEQRRAASCQPGR